MKKTILHSFIVLAIALFTSCSSDDKALLENTMEINGETHYINGGFIDSAHTIDEDFDWDFAVIVTLYGDGINYDPQLRRFTGKGFVLRMKMHSSIHGLELGEYIYGESGDPLTFNESFYTTDFDVNSDLNQIEATIVSGNISVDKDNKHIIHFNLTDDQGNNLRGYSVHWMF